MEAPPPDRITLRFLAAPTEADADGGVGAGRVLEWIDKAGYACAAGWAKTYCVTAYVGNVSFVRPLRTGDLVEATARIVHTGTSSMHVLVTVSSGDPREGRLTPATDCLMVFVAVRDGRPTRVPAWEPRDADDRARQEDTRRRIGLRQEIADSLAQQRFTEHGTAPRVTLRFLAAPTDVNWGGKVHGGIVMRWIDDAARLLATRWTGNHRTKAVFVGSVRFYQPLRIGDLVEVEARLLHTGRRSMHVSVHVRSGAPTASDLAVTTHCLSILVGLDDSDAAAVTPTWEPRTEEDRALDGYARHLVALRGHPEG